MTDLELAEEIERKLQVSYSMRPNSQRSMLLDRCEWQQIIAALRRGPERPPGEMVTERMVEVAAKWISESPLIQEPKLPPPAWMGLARHILQAAAEAEGRKG